MDEWRWAVSVSLTSEGSFRIKNGNATACIEETALRISVFRVILNQSTKALQDRMIVDL